jgi:hypothetical protein
LDQFVGERFDLGADDGAAELLTPDRKTLTFRQCIRREPAYLIFQRTLRRIIF